MVCRNMLHTESYRLLNTPREYLLAKAIDTEDKVYRRDDGKGQKYISYNLHKNPRFRR